MNRFFSALVALSLSVSAAFAGGSTINTGIPAQGSALTSAPIRQNFTAAATDINNLLSMFAGASSPATPVTFQLWANPTLNPAPVAQFDGTQFVNVGFLNRTAHTYGSALSSDSITAIDSTIVLSITAGKASISVGTLANSNLANASTTVNGVTCTLGSTCTIAASAGTITPGTTTVASGTPNGLLFDNGGFLGNLATGNNGVLVTSGAGVPSISTTLPSGLAATNLSLTTPTIAGGALSGTFSGNHTISGVPTFTGLGSSGTCANSLVVTSAGLTFLAACPGAATAITVGSTTVTSGTPGDFLTVGTGPTLAQVAPTGTGSVVLATSPSLTTPSLSSPTLTTPTISGAATATSGPSTSAANQYVYTVATGTITLSTAGLTGNTCTAAQTATATGAATTDVLDISFASDPTSTTGFAPPASLAVYPYVTTNTANVKVCNNTSVSVTLGAALVLNWRVRR